MSQSRRVHIEYSSSRGKLARRLSHRSRSISGFYQLISKVRRLDLITDFDADHPRYISLRALSQPHRSTHRSNDEAFILSAPVHGIRTSRIIICSGRSKCVQSLYPYNLRVSAPRLIEDLDIILFRHDQYPCIRRKERKVSPQTVCCPPG